jgi:hypothetical protein
VVSSAELRVDTVSGSEPVGDIFELDRDLAGDFFDSDSDLAGDEAA